MNIKTVFRLILISSLLFEILSILPQYFSPLIKNENVKSLHEWNGYGGIFEISHLESILIISFVVIAILMVISFIGVFLFKKWARTLYVILTISLYMTLPFWGITIYLPWEDFFHEIATILGGVVFAMMYLEPISSEFNKKSRKTQLLSKPKVL